MKQRIITAIAILAVVIPALVFGNIFLNILISFIVCMGGIEWMNVNSKEHRIPWFVQILALIFCMTSIIVPENYKMIVLAGASLLFLSLPVFDEKIHAKDSFNILSYLLMFNIIATSFLTVYLKDPNLIYFMLIATYGCDTGAYFVGRFLGKHKLNERISPKKTIEGSIGGCVLGTLLAIIFGFMLLPSFNKFFIVISAFLMTIFGQVGDLAFSAIKRNFNIKDYSKLLPGHGGVLDRIDSLVFNFLVLFICLGVFGL